MSNPTPLIPDRIANNRFLTLTSTENGITAAASGGGQAGAYLFRAQSNQISTCAVSGNGVALPKITLTPPGSSNMAQMGQLIYVRNDGAQTLQIYAGIDGKGTINGIASASGIQVPAASVFIGWVSSYSQSTDVGNWSGAVLSTAAPGTGTVTSVAVTAANGVSGTVANPTTAPAISIALGDITPNSVTVTTSTQVLGAQVPTSGVGVESFYTGGIGGIFAYDRTPANDTYMPFGVGGSYIRLSTGTGKGVSAYEQVRITNTVGSNNYITMTGGLNTNALISVAGGKNLAFGVNLGIAVGPSVWSSGNALEVNSEGCGIWGAGVNNTYLTSNAYYNTASKFGQAGWANQIAVGNGTGTYYFQTSSASGAKDGAITWNNVAQISTTGTMTLLDGIKGTATASDATTGNVGEYLEQNYSSVNFPASGTVGDAGTALTLTAGDWDVTFTGALNGNGATGTTQGWLMGIGTASGPSLTGVTFGTTGQTLYYDAAVISGGGNIGPVRFKTAGVTLYPKIKVSAYAGGPPQFTGSLHARRIR